jgi:hypothetical protein
VIRWVVHIVTTAPEDQRVFASHRSLASSCVTSRVEWSVALPLSVWEVVLGIGAAKVVMKSFRVLHTRRRHSVLNSGRRVSVCLSAAAVYVAPFRFFSWPERLSCDRTEPQLSIQHRAFNTVDTASLWYWRYVLRDKNRQLIRSGRLTAQSTVVDSREQLWSWQRGRVTYLETDSASKNYTFCRNMPLSLYLCLTSNLCTVINILAFMHNYKHIGIYAQL